MPLYTYNGGVVIDAVTGKGVAAKVGAATDFVTGDPVATYNLNDDVIPTVLATNRDGYYPSFRSTSDRVLVRFGSVTLALDSIDLYRTLKDEAVAARQAAEAAVSGATAPTDSAVAASIQGKTTQTKNALRARGPILAEEYGIVGDGVADEGVALTALLASAATAGRVVRLPPKGVIRSTSVITVPSGARIAGNGAVIKNAMASASGRVFTLSGVTDVIISDLTIDGDKASFAGTTEQRHNVHIVNSQRVVLSNVVTKNAKGDGIYIGDDVHGPATDVTLTNVACLSNHRNGLSISAARHVHVSGSSFNYNGGTSPMSGLDIEPNVDAAIWEDITFVDCDFSYNGYDGAIVQAKSVSPTQRQSGASFIGCRAVGNGTSAVLDFGNGVQLRWAKNVSWVGGSIRDNLRRGVWLRDACSNIVIDATIESNGREGVGQIAGPNDNVTDLVIRGVIWNNGQRDATVAGAPVAAGNTDGVALTGAGARLKFEATSGGGQQRYGLRTLAGWSGVGISASARFPGNLTGPASLNDDLSSRTVVCADLGWRVGRAAATDQAFTTRLNGDSSDRFAFRVDGRLQWSVGTSVVDVTLERTAAGTLGVGAGHAFRTGRAVTASRPAAGTVGSGATFYDTTLGKPIWSDGSVWRDAMGTAV